MRGLAVRRISGIAESIKPCVRRWFELLVVSAVAALVCLLCQPLFDIAVVRLTDLFEHFSEPVPFLVLFGVTSFLWFMLVRLGGARLSDLWSINTVRFPPIWVSILIGAVSYLGLRNHLSRSQVRPMVPDVHLLVRTAALMAFAIAFAGLCAKVLEDKRRRPLEPSSEEGHTEVDSFESLLRDSKRLIEWLDKESPVKDTREDYFDLRVYAGRIVDVLRETPLRTVAIVGPYGCGKSSTLNMVDSYLSRARLCWVEFNSNYCLPVLSWKSWKSFTKEVGRAILSMH